jgi:hypothetical protein
VVANPLQSERKVSRASNGQAIFLRKKFFPWNEQEKPAGPKLASLRSKHLKSCKKPKAVCDAVGEGGSMNERQYQQIKKT